MTPEVQAGIQKAGIVGAQHHIFVCLGPDCCDPTAGETLWKHIKSRIRDTDIPVMRTKAQCFRICAGGPWIVVYPDGAWYGAVTPERFECILQEHLINGRPINDWITVENQLQ